MRFERLRPNRSVSCWKLAGIAGRYTDTWLPKCPKRRALKDWVRRYNDHARDTQESLVACQQACREEPASGSQNRLPRTSVSVPFNSHKCFGTSNRRQRRKRPRLRKKSSRHLRSPCQISASQGILLDFMPRRLGSEANQPISPPSKRQEHNLGSSADSFRSEFGAKKPASETRPPAPKEGPKLGEFTSFFQGPFRPDGPSEIPPVSSREMEPPRKSVGDFTAMFGAATPQERSAPASEAPRSDVPSSGFTGLFNTLENPSRTLSGTPLSGGPSPIATDVPATLPPPRQEPPPAPLPPVYVAPTPPVFPTVQPPLLHRPPAPVSPRRPPGEQPVPSQLPAPSPRQARRQFPAVRARTRKSSR